MNANMICIYEECYYCDFGTAASVNYIKFNKNDIDANSVLNLFEIYGSRKENYLKYGKVVLLISDWIYEYNDENIKFFNLHDILAPDQICYKQEYLRYNVEDLIKLHLYWLKYKENNLKLSAFYNKFVTKKFLEYIHYVA